MTEQSTDTQSNLSPADEGVTGQNSLKPFWHVVVALSGSVLLLAALFPHTVMEMIELWDSSETYSHCFFILPIMLYLLYSRREHLHDYASPSVSLSLLVIPPAVLWLLGYVSEINIVMHAGLVGMLMATVLSLCGVKLGKQAFSSLFFLVFLIPFGDEIVPQLVDVTADFTVATIKMLGIPLYREGNHFSLPTGRWSVVEACSGVRYLMASVTLGYVYALLNYEKTHKRIIFLLVSAVLPIVANGLRAVIIVLIGHHSGMELATGVDHLIYGWVFFGIVIFVLFWVGQRWRDDPVPADSDMLQREIQYAGVQEQPSASFFKWDWQKVVALGLVLVFTGAPVLWSKSLTFHASEESIPLNIPDQASDSVTSTEIDWKPDFHEPDHLVEGTLVTGQTSYRVRLLAYGTRAGGAELASTGNKVVRPGNRESILLEHRSIETKAGSQPVTWQQALIRHGAEALSVSYFYQVGDQPVSSGIEVKYLEAINRLTGNPMPSVVVFFIRDDARKAQPEFMTGPELTELYQSLQRGD